MDKFELFGTVVDRQPVKIFLIKVSFSPLGQDSAGGNLMPILKLSPLEEKPLPGRGIDWALSQYCRYP